MSENTRRARQFKNQGRGGEDGRRKRADASVELRKMKKDDQLMKRRNVSEDIDLDEPVSPLKERSQNAATTSASPMSMVEIVAAIKGTDSTKRMQAVQTMRKILSQERRPPIDDFINAGVLPHLVEFLGESSNPTLQFETAWALTNIASGTCEQTESVVKAGAIPKFVALLRSPEENVCEQAVWALGNIAGDGPQLRDMVIDAGAVQPLLTLAKLDVKVAFLRNVAWTLSNLCRNKNPPPPFNSCCECLTTFSQLLNHSDKEVLSDTCWALSYITDGPNEKIQAVLDSGVLRRLVELMYREECAVITPALRTVGNIVTGSDTQTQAVVDTPGAMQALLRLLSNDKSTIKKEAAWAISNITAGSQAQIQAVIDANIIPSVIELMEKGDFKSQKEAVWVITNLTSGGSIEQTGYVYQAGCLSPLIELLTVNDAKTILVVLDAINNILVAATKFGARDQICLNFEELSGLDKLETLQEHNNEEIYKYALRLIETYFCDDDQDEDADLAPAQQSEQFQFSAPTTDASQPPDNGFSF